MPDSLPDEFDIPEAADEDEVAALSGKPSRTNRVLMIVVVVLVVAVAAVGFLVVQSVFEGREPQTLVEVELQELEEKLRETPEDIGLHMRKAELHHSIGEDEEALSILLQAQSSIETTGSVTALMELGIGRLYYGLGDTEQAIEHIEAGLAARELVDLVFWRGVIAFETGDPSTAEAMWLRAAELSPEDASIMLDLARLYEEEGRNEEALTLYVEAQRFLPDDPEIAAGIARLSDEGGQ